MVRALHGHVTLKALFRRGYEFEGGPMLAPDDAGRVKRAMIFGLKHYFPGSGEPFLNPTTADLLVNDLFTQAILLAPAIPHFENYSHFWDLVRTNVPWANMGQDVIDGPLLELFVYELQEAVEQYNLNPLTSPPERLTTKAPATITNWIIELKRVAPDNGPVAEEPLDHAERSDEEDEEPPYYTLNAKTETEDAKYEAESKEVEESVPEAPCQLGVFTFNTVVLPDAKMASIGRAMKRLRLEDSELATKVDEEEGGEDELPHKAAK